MPAPNDVKRVLARLATRTADAPSGQTPSRSFFSTTTDYRSVIDDADAARAELDQAAEFVASTGVDRLDDAIEAARSAGDYAAARRGRDARRAFSAFRDACRGDGDQFHSGRAIDLGGGDEGPIK